MIRVSVFYPHQPGARFDFDYYRGKHAPLVLTRLGPFGVERAELDRGLADGAGVAPEFIAVAHFFARDLDQFNAGLRAHRAELVADVPNFTSVSPAMQVSEIL